jgi:hypothetical protein
MSGFTGGADDGGVGGRNGVSLRALASSALRRWQGRSRARSCPARRALLHHPHRGPGQARARSGARAQAEVLGGSRISTACCAAQPTLAVIGGIGRYRRARGTLTLRTLDEPRSLDLRAGAPAPPTAPITQNGRRLGGRSHEARNTFPAATAPAPARTSDRTRARRAHARSGRPSSRADRRAHTPVSPWRSSRQTRPLRRSWSSRAGVCARGAKRWCSEGEAGVMSAGQRFAWWCPVRLAGSARGAGSEWGRPAPGCHAPGRRSPSGPGRRSPPAWRSPRGMDVHRCRPPQGHAGSARCLSASFICSKPTSVLASVSHMAGRAGR